MPAPITLPKNLSAFVSGSAKDDIQRLEDAVNAFQSLKVQVTINGTQRVVTATIQISGDSAILEINL